MRCDVSSCRQGILGCLAVVHVIIYCWCFSWNAVKGKTPGSTDTRGAARHTSLFKYLVSRKIFIAVQVNKKANNEEVLAPS